MALGAVASGANIAQADGDNGGMLSDDNLIGDTILCANKDLAPVSQLDEVNLALEGGHGLVVVSNFSAQALVEGHGSVLALGGDGACAGVLVLGSERELVGGAI